MSLVAGSLQSTGETQFWIPLSFVSRRWGRTDRAARQWCNDGTFREFGYDTFRDEQNRWWIGLSEEDVAGWARGLPVIRDIRLHQQLSGVSAVYFVGDSRFVKIGYSTDLLSHLANIQVSVPHRVFLIGLRKGGESDVTKIHKIFHEHWHFADWFKMNEPVCRWINSKTKTPEQFFRPHRNPSFD